MRPTALKAYTDELQKIGNPSALHSLGQQSRLRLEDSREVLAGAVGASTPAEVVLTSGGTEADNLAIKGLFWHRNGVPAEGAGTPTPAPELSHPVIITTPIEHNAVLDTAGWLETQGAQVLLVDVDADGRIKLNHLEELLREHGDRTALVSIMYANNEIGTVQPIKEAAALAKAAGVPIHTDAVQAFGQLPLNFADLGVDAMTVTAHKIGGPVGIGALILSRDIKAVPVLHGGGQERSLRSGTLDVAGAAAFAAAAQEATGDLVHEAPRLSGLRDRLIAGIEQGVPDAHLSGHREDRLPGNVHFTFPRSGSRFPPVPAGRGRVCHLGRFGLQRRCQPAQSRAPGLRTQRRRGPLIPAVHTGPRNNRRRSRQTHRSPARCCRAGTQSRHELRLRLEPSRLSRSSE